MSSNDEEDGEEDEEEEEEEEEDAASGCSMVDQAVNLRSGLRVFVFPTVVTLCGLVWAATTGKTESSPLECLARARVFSLLALGSACGKGDPLLCGSPPCACSPCCVLAACGLL